MSRNKGKTIFGLAIITLGVLWTLANLGIIPDGIGRYWPVFLIFWGINQVTSAKDDED